MTMKKLNMEKEKIKFSCVRNLFLMQYYASEVC